MQRRGLRLAAGVLRALRWLCLIAAVLCVVVVAVALVFPESFVSVELVVPLGFRVEGPAAILSAGPESRPLIIHNASGFTRVSADTAGMVLIGSAIFISGCLAVAVACRHFRRIVVAAVNDRPFADSTASDVRRIGWMVSALGMLQSFYIVATFLYASARMTSVVIEPALQPLRGLPLVIGGLVVLALGTVFDRGAELQRDHDLTV